MQRPTETIEAEPQVAQVGQPTTVARMQEQKDRVQMSGKVQASASVPPAFREGRNCCHHWVIEFAVGPLSRGECRLCGAERVFRNHLQWAEIAPVRAITGRRQADDNSTISEKRGEGRRPFDSAGAEQMGEIFGYAVARRG